MNLSLVLLVLSAFVAYLIYDMFKKSRQEQQIIQAQTASPQATNKLRPTYAAECGILKCLHEEKMNGLKHKSISIHLLEDPAERGELSSEGKMKVREVVEQIQNTHKLHLLVSRNAEVSNPLLKYLRELQLPEIGFQSTEGGVAILRQLNCNIHLESQPLLYKTLVQYLPNVWMTDSARTGEKFINQYKSEWEMLTSLGQLSTARRKEE